MKDHYWEYRPKTEGTGTRIPRCLVMNLAACFAFFLAEVLFLPL